MGCYAVHARQQLREPGSLATYNLKTFDAAQWTPGSKGAHVLLEDFVRRRLAAFDADRAKADRLSTSRLSPHVHFGEISVRYIFCVACPSLRVK